MHCFCNKPEIRDEAVNVFITEERVHLLLDAIENQIVQPATIGWERSPTMRLPVLK